ncbi:MAG: GNAT family N-acetyltransferase [Candidatus Binatus sp.]
MLNKIRFEQLTASDGPIFYDLRRKAIRAGCGGHYTDSQIKLWTDPMSDVPLEEPLPTHFYFAKIEDEIVASGMLEIESGRIDAMFVLPAFFGRGIGRAVMRHLEGVARQRGLLQLTLDATLNAAAFYRSLGFLGDLMGTFNSPRGVSLECVKMTKGDCQKFCVLSRFIND